MPRLGSSGAPPGGAAAGAAAAAAGAAAPAAAVAGLGGAFAGLVDAGSVIAGLAAAGGGTTGDGFFAASGGAAARGRAGLPIIVMPPAFGPGAPPSEIVITSRRSASRVRPPIADDAASTAMSAMWPRSDAVTMRGSPVSWRARSSRTLVTASTLSAPRAAGRRCPPARCRRP